MICQGNTKFYLKESEQLANFTISIYSLLFKHSDYENNENDYQGQVVLMCKQILITSTFENSYEKMNIDIGAKRIKELISVASSLAL